MGTNTDVSACLTPSTYDLYASSFLYVNVARLIFFFIGDITISGHWFLSSQFSINCLFMGPHMIYLEHHLHQLVWLNRLFYYKPY